MTVLFTEVSPAGIIMCADSQISAETTKGKWLVFGRPQEKVLRFGRGFGMSYYGYVGRLVAQPDLVNDINLWFHRLYEETQPSGPTEFATALAEKVNERWNARPEGAGHETIGFHVAGYESSKPVVFHVHNQHGHFDRVPDADGIPTAKWVCTSDPDTPVRVYRDYPDGAMQNSGLSPE